MDRLEGELTKELMDENKSLHDQVAEVIKNRMDADAYMTAAISAIEDLDWDEAQNMAQAVLDTSCNIEQRLAATFIFTMSVERNALSVSAWLAIAYQYE